MGLPGGLETPALVVDIDRLERNLAAMASAAKAAGVVLRPHAKTHKCVPLARRQLGHEAAGLTVATLDEAELFAAGGCDDLFIAYPLWAGGGRRARLAALRERASLLVGVDNVVSAEQLAAVPGPPLRVLVEVDSGGRRSGVAPREAGTLAAACLRLGLEVAGAFTHPGHAYQGPAAVVAAAEDERAALRAAGQALDGVLAGPVVLSGGSTPTASAGLEPPLTEVRPGTYVFGDRQQTRLSGTPLADIALVVAARVVSVPRPGEAVLDAGSKALSSDRPAWLPGYGEILEAPEATVDALTEEHAVVRGLRTTLRVGDLVRVVPNHVCTAVNLARELVVVTDGAIADRWPAGTGRR